MIILCPAAAFRRFRFVSIHASGETIPGEACRGTAAARKADPRETVKIRKEKQR